MPAKRHLGTDVPDTVSGLLRPSIPVQRVWKELPTNPDRNLHIRIHVYTITPSLSRSPSVLSNLHFHTHPIQNFATAPSPRIIFQKSEIRYETPFHFQVPISIPGNRGSGMKKIIARLNLEYRFQTPKPRIQNPESIYINPLARFPITPITPNPSAPTNTQPRHLHPRSANPGS
ncbi:hypothetical protein EAF00_009280 [Botryotinia globosa]|nr:hypothetical protein EAF00_009280 [Botryotinia globosa]